MSTFDAMLWAAEASGIADYRIVKSAYGYNNIKITYKNGAVIEKPECEACYLNAHDASKYYKNGGKWMKCLGCKHRELTE